MKKVYKEETQRKKNSTGFVPCLNLWNLRTAGYFLFFIYGASPGNVYFNLINFGNFVSWFGLHKMCSGSELAPKHFITKSNFKFDTSSATISLFESIEQLSS